MAIGLIGRKVGMSRVFTDDGRSIPVTVVKVPPNCVTQKKTIESDGYMALQLATDERSKIHRVPAALVGHFSKHDSTQKRAYRLCNEFRINEKEMKEVGDALSVDIFEIGQKVKVASISKGKGFAGVIKRHNFSGQDRSHGNSISHRVHGSVGQCQDPGRVFPGKKMAGRMGSDRVTMINVEVIEVDKEQELLMLKGSVPGAPNGKVIIQHSEHIDLSALEQARNEMQEQVASEAVVAGGAEDAHNTEATADAQESPQEDHKDAN